MAFFSESGGDRRRRVLNDQVIPRAPAAASPPAAAGEDEPEAPGPTYNGTALASQLLVSDLVARRRITILLWFLSASLAVVGLAALDVHAPDWAEIISAEHAAAFDLTARGSLASWYSSLLLGMAAGASLVIYSIRRHKLDDFHGRYRVWIWVAACCVLASVNATASLHLVFTDAMIHWTGWTFSGDLLAWRLAPAGLALLLVGTRLVGEMRPCRFGMALFALACAFWTAAVVVELGWMPLEPGLSQTMFAVAGTMFGHVLLLTSLAVYARHVVFEASGLLPAVALEKKPKKKRKRLTVSTDDDTEESSAKRSGSQRRKAQAAARSDLDAPASADAGSSERKLSKAERRRLRKEQSRHERQAA